MAVEAPPAGTGAEVVVREWRTIDPSTEPALRGRFLDTPALRAQAEGLRVRIRPEYGRTIPLHRGGCLWGGLA
jgi:hypothetical protein